MKNEWGMAPRSIGVAQLFIIHYSLLLYECLRVPSAQPNYSLFIIHY